MQTRDAPQYIREPEDQQQQINGESSVEEIIEKVESLLPPKAIEEDIDQLLRDIELNPLDERLTLQLIDYRILFLNPQNSEVLTEVPQVLSLSHPSPEFNLYTPSPSFPVRKSKRLKIKNKSKVEHMKFNWVNGNKMNFEVDISDNDYVSRQDYVLTSFEYFDKNCLKQEQGKQFSIDEMIIPYKGKRAGSRRQYIKSKPKKWGFKFIVRAGINGMVYDFFPYCGETTFDKFTFSNYENKYFGLGPKLIYHLRKKYGILSLGTVQENRLRNCPLLKEKELKKTEEETIRRYSKVTKSYVDVLPKIIEQYNTHMGGVVLADMLVSLYRTELKTHKWYMAVFSQMLDEFRINIGIALNQRNRQSKVGRKPAKNNSTENTYIKLQELLFQGLLIMLNLINMITPSFEQLRVAAAIVKNVKPHIFVQ
ncbi:piggyBac transposable element-derived protein 3-like, partial [Aphis craccivora]